MADLPGYPAQVFPPPLDRLCAQAHRRAPRHRETGGSGARSVRPDGRRARSGNRPGVFRRQSDRSGRNHDPRRPRDHGHCAVLVAVSSGAGSRDPGRRGTRGQIRRSKRRRRARGRRAQIHPRGAGRNHAALSAGLSDRARRLRAGHDRRQDGERGRHDFHRAMAAASPREALGQSQRVHSATLPVRPCPGPFRLSAVRRRPAGVHRRAFRAGRSHPGAGEDRRPLPHRPAEHAAGDADGRGDHAARLFTDVPHHPTLTAL